MNPLLSLLLDRALRLPWVLLLLIVLIASAGFTMLYSAASGDVSLWAQPQMVRFAAGLVVLYAVAVIPLQQWMQWTYFIYAAVLVLLIVVEVTGHIGMGAQRWIDLGVITLQPSELAKISTILALSHYFQHFPPHKYLRIQYILIPLALIAVPVAFILRQPNLGTATLLCGIAGWVMFAAGVHRRYFYIAIISVACAAPVVWHFMHDYQKQRVATFLDPSADPLGSGYNISQSMIAIGSGGMSGKGLLQGSQTQLDFLPEKQTDFIFTVLAEEFGFIGGATLLLLYSLMILHIIAIGHRSKSMFGALIGHGVAAMLTLHMFINVGMVMGLLPVVGIPLPLLSYGGSNMISIMLALGLTANVWVHRDTAL